LAELLTCDVIVDGELIERYLAGALSETEAEALESHYLTCARCQNELRLAAAIRDVLPELREAAQAPDVSPATETANVLGAEAPIGEVRTVAEFRWAPVASAAAADETNPRVQEWEALMWQYQQPLPLAQPGEKWLRMERIFKLAR